MKNKTTFFVSNFKMFFVDDICEEKTALKFEKYPWLAYI